MGNENKGEVLIYQSEDGLTHIDVKMEDETVWLTQQQMAELFQTSRTNVVEHIKHIYEENELNEISTCRNFRQVRREGSRNVNRNIPYYNLDMIISLGYRIKSSIATRYIFNLQKIIALVKYFSASVLSSSIALVKSCSAFFKSPPERYNNSPLSA